MIYKHYKGGLYYLVGYAISPISVNDFYDVFKLTEEKSVKALYEPTLEEVNVKVFTVDKSRVYIYDSKHIAGVLCFYKDLNGQHWLRPINVFHGDIMTKDGEMIHRFEKMSSNLLFHDISLTKLLSDSKQN